MSSDVPSMDQGLVPDVLLGPIALPLQSDSGTLPFQLWYYEFGGERWVVACTGQIDDGEPVPLRIESACLFGHVLHSVKCDCQYQLDEAFNRIGRLRRGLVIYAIDQDARGLGIEAHFHIYMLRQQENLDTAAVYGRLQAPVDARSYEPVALILKHLNIQNVRLLTNNPRRAQFLVDQGFAVITDPLESPLDIYNMSTLMLEKEDLGYTWSFKTHADWLAPLQARVDGVLNRQAAILVASTHFLIAEYEDEVEWNVARGLLSATQKIDYQQGETVVYVTDYPRVDELPIYAYLGAMFVVLPFADIPTWLYDAGQSLGIRIQDWGRDNKYMQLRPQWDLVYHTDGMHAYRRENVLRCVFPKDTDESSQFQRMRILYQIADAVFSAAQTPYITRVQAGSCPWFEVCQSTNVNVEQLREVGFVVFVSHQPDSENSAVLLLDCNVNQMLQVVPIRGAAIANLLKTL